jgi:hypothetical protein
MRLGGPRLTAAGPHSAGPGSRSVWNLMDLPSTCGGPGMDLGDREPMLARGQI